MVSGCRKIQLAPASGVPHLMAMSNAPFYSRRTANRQGATAATFGAADARGPIIDQDGREIPAETLGSKFYGFRFDLGHSSANPFPNLSREQRLARLEAGARLLDGAFLMPGTNIRHCLSGTLRLAP